MNWWGRLLRRMEQEAHLEKELRFHIEQRIAHLTRSGLGEEEARRKVRQEFGGMDQVKEDCRDARGTRWIEDFGQDARYALRLLTRNPAFAAIVLATLALGIGINTAAFTFFNAFVLRPLPIRDPEALVKLNALGRNGRIQNFSIAEYRDLRDGNGVFSGVIALAPLPVSLGDAVAGRAATDYSIIPPGYQFAFGLTVSGNYFAVLGGQPAFGRLLTPEDDVTAGAHAVVVLSESFWRKQFGGDPTLVGRTIRFNGRPYEVVGIATKEFVGTQPNVPDFWVPLAMRGQ